jgi:hypothetical protein
MDAARAGSGGNQEFIVRFIFSQYDSYKTMLVGAFFVQEKLMVIKSSRCLNSSFSSISIGIKITEVAIFLSGKLLIHYKYHERSWPGSNKCQERYVFERNRPHQLGMWRSFNSPLRSSIKESFRL